MRSIAALPLIFAGLLAAAEPIGDHTPVTQEPAMTGSLWRSEDAKWIRWYQAVEGVRKARSERALDDLRDRAETHSLAAATLFPGRPDAAKILGAVTTVEAGMVAERLQTHRGKPGAEAAWYALHTDVANVQAYDALIGLLASTGDDPWLAAVGRPRLALLRSMLEGDRANVAGHPAGKREQALLATADALLRASSP